MKQILTILFLLSFTFINATIINVPVPYATIQAGINAAANGDTVLVQPYTYYETINYNGKLIIVASLYLTTADTSFISSTIIDGSSSGSVVTFENGEDLSAVLYGFTLTNGNNYNGGGVVCTNSSPSLLSVIITGNSAIFGGGIYCYYYCNPNIENVTITGNYSDYGGGINLGNFSCPNLLNVTIAGNSATYDGGAIRCIEYSSPNLEKVTITANGASYGGGISCYIDSSPTVLNSILWNDSEEIYINSGSVSVTYSDIQYGWAGTGNIATDPLFEDPLNGNFNLTYDSPCVDTGDPYSPLDPDGSRADMGAYPYYQNLIADFTSNTQSGEFPLTVNFTDLSIGNLGAIDEWLWDFGDGNNSTLQNPTNDYLIPGIYTVSLTVTDIHDSTDTKSKLDFITVYSPAYSSSTWHISTSGSDMTGNGSELYPFATIPHGITSSSNTDTVLVHPGSYYGNIDYYGKIITIGSLYLTTQDESYISSTILEGNGAGSVVTFNHVEDSLAVLCGFTIINGYASYGGGIYCNYSYPNLQNLVLTGNHALDGGGIACVNNSVPLISNLTIYGNTAENGGGGIFCDNNSNPVFINSVLWNDSPNEIFLEGQGGSVTATYSNIQNGFIGTGNIYHNPLYVDPFNNNFNLLYNSPCINTGDPSSPLDPDGSRADMGAHCFDKSIGASEITNVTDVPNDQGRSVIVTWQRSIWDEEFSIVPIVYYGLWEKYPFELDRDYIVTNDINEAIEKKDTYFQREDTTWVYIANVPAMQWEEYLANAVTYFDSAFAGNYLSYFFVSAHTAEPSLYFKSSVASGYSVDNIAPDETDVAIAQNGSNIGLIWDEVEYGTFQGNYYPEINGIWYKIYTGDTPDFVCDEAHLIDTVTNLNYDYPLAGEEKKFFRIVVNDQP